MLVTSHLGFIAHNAFLESHGEDSPFLSKGRRQKTVVAITEKQEG